MATYKYSELADSFKLVKPVSKVKFEYSPKSKELFKLLEPFIGVDQLRPAMTGIHFNGVGVEATNAHVMAILANTNLKDEGIFTADGRKIDANFPDYRSVIPKDNQHKHLVDCLKLKTYCETVESGQFANQTTKQVRFTLTKNFAEDKKEIAFNSEFLIDTLTFWLKLGYDKVEMHLEAANRPALFTPPGGKAITDHTTLLMPVMVGMYNQEQTPDINPGYLAACDLDFGRELIGVYDLSRNVVLQPDGAHEVRTDITRQTCRPQGAVTLEQLALIRKLLKGNIIIPILENCNVKSGHLVLTDLEFSYRLLNCGLPDGMYNVLPGGLLSSPTENADDFPIIPDDTRRYDVKSVCIVSGPEFARHFNKAASCTSKDDLRPVYMGVHLNINPEEKIFEIEGTDAHTAYRALYPNAEYSKEHYNCIVGSVNKVKEVFEKFSFYPFTISKTNDKDKKVFDYTKIATEHWEIITRNIDARYPNIEQVTAPNYNKKVTVSVSDIRKIKAELTKLKKDYFSAAFTLKNETTFSVSAYRGANNKQGKAVKYLFDIPGTVKDEETKYTPGTFIAARSINSDESEAFLELGIAVLDDLTKALSAPTIHIHQNTAKPAIYMISETGEATPATAPAPKKVTPPSPAEVANETDIAAMKIAQGIEGRATIEKLLKQGYKIQFGKYSREAYLSFFGIGEGVYPDKWQEKGITLVAPPAPAEDKAKRLRIAKAKAAGLKLKLQLLNQAA